MSNQIVCFGLTPWQSGIPARTEQLISRLASRGEVLYFEPPYRSNGAKSRQVRPNVTAIPLPPPLPMVSIHPALFRRWQQRAARFAAKTMDNFGIRDPLFWLSSPEWLPLIEGLPRKGLIYDCTRDFSLLPVEWEQELAYTSDVCLAASPSLAAHLNHYSANAVVVPNGCNFPVFAGVHPRRDSRHKVFTYCGTLWDDLILEPLLACARAHPEWNFRLAGAVEERSTIPPQVAALPNVVLTGPYEPRDMAAILNESDVCLNLLRRDATVLDVIPNRIYEYLATGKPIVSMLYPEQIESFADTIYGASSPREFIRCCERAVLETADFLPERRRRHALAANWSHRAEQVAEILSGIGLFQY